LAEQAGLADPAHRRHLARFYCDHDRKLSEALRLAQEDLSSREDIFAYDTLAWALYKSDRPREAAAEVERAMKLGTQSAPLFYHAGMIYHRLGDSDKARELLHRALLLNPRFSLADSENARRALR
jgi:tetratricopeptide (TPR) repeat protein